MGRYLLDHTEFKKKLSARVLQLILSLFFLWNLSFFLLRVLPGSPFAEEANLNPKIEALFKEHYGLGDSFLLSYAKSLASLLRADLGISLFFEGRAVTELVGQALKITLPIAGIAFLIAIFVSLALSLWYEFSSPVFKQILNYFSLMILSAPQLLIVPVVIWFFCFKLQWLPIAFLDHWYSYLLPIFFISLRPVWMLFRILKNEMAFTKKTLFYMHAQALGYSRTQLYFKVLLANSLGAWVAQLGTFFGQFVAGSLLIELVLGFDGLGSLFLAALSGRDVPLLSALIFLIGIFVMLSQLLVDLLNYSLDQRQKLL
jgi:oligopeptide transport system permease protein